MAGITGIGDIINEIKKLALNEVGNAIVNVDKSVAGLVKSFGQGIEFSEALTKSMIGAVTQVQLLGGTWNDVVQIQQQVSDSLNRNLILSSEQNQKLFAAQQASGQNAGIIATAFKDAGYSVYDSSSKMSDIVNTARELGVNVKSVTDKVVSNMGVLNQYNFVDGVEGLAKMATQASELRINMESTLGFARNVFKPEGAIEMAAALQRLGVAQSELLDPLRLMDLSANDPTELQNQIVQMTQQFVKMNEAGKMEIVDKRAFYELSEEMKIPYDQLTKMALGTEELNEKMSQIKFPDNITPKQREMIANLAEMEGGVAKISFNDASGNFVTKLVQDLKDPKEIEAITKLGEKKTLEDLTAQQLSFIQDIRAKVTAIASSPAYGIAGSKSISSGKKSVRNIVDVTGKNVTQVINAKNASQEIDKLANDFIKPFVNLISGKESLFQAAQEWNKGVGNLKTSVEKFGDKIIEAVKLSTKELKLNDKGEVVPVKDFIKFPDEKVKPLESDTILGLTKGPEFLKNISNNQNNNNQTQTSDASKPQVIEITLKHDINITAPSNIDSNQLMMVLKTNDVQQGIIESIRNSLTNNGLSGNPSKTQSIENFRTVLT